MDWDKHGIEPELKKSGSPKERRLAVPVTEQLDSAIEQFKNAYPHKKFSDAAVLKTMIEAGFRVWFTQRTATQEPDVSDA